MNSYAYLLCFSLLLLSSGVGEAEVVAGMSANAPANEGMVFTSNLGSDVESDVPVYITEDHHSVLKFWFNSSLTKRTPKGATLIHFDSHPDLSTPMVFPKQIPKKLSSLEDSQKIDIDSFILAGVWADVVGHVIWVRPEWGHQMDDVWRMPGYLGTGHARSKEKSKFKVTFPELFWAMNNSTVESSKYLDEMQPMLLTVVSLSDLVKKVSQSQFYYHEDLKNADSDMPLYTYLGLDKETPYILDIDLDFYATLNPEWDRVAIAEIEEHGREFLKLFRLECICSAKTAEGVAAQAFVCDKTLKLIGTEELYLRSLSEFLDKTKSLQDLFCTRKCGFKGDVVLKAMYNWINEELIPELRKELSGKSLTIAVRNVLHGIYTASNGPHCREVSLAHVKKDIAKTETFLRGIGARPGVTTVGRSVSDGFTPLTAWVEIEGRVLNALENLYGNTTIELDSHNSRTVGFAPHFNVLPPSNIIMKFNDLPHKIRKRLKSNKQFMFYYNQQNEYRPFDGLSMPQIALAIDPSSSDSSSSDGDETD